MKKLLTVQEVADLLNCSSRTVYRLLSEGELKGGKIRSGVRIISSSVDFYIERIVSSFQIENGPYLHEKKCD